ncbi:ribosomal biogenesis GTPase [Metamycoplasma arthritidis]|uniref:Ribosome biogenesis GTPase A n=1 Tax=Metamycoplasma arthritidis (strain 158L3-1) TaxID=243272 RepID=B3PMI4_META1|nr:ribosome biogenesis GTPase YlqF [Metamycoplasma arthritidis]ACF07236.1 GTPase protein YlqF [Metamycoplasma arthritidis 158L3-1]VEU78760.1 ribosomal biogenesis GTPase [Metamycoplasma arthritidis]
MIHWFPGHMAKEFRLLKDKQKLFDLFIIIIDSRIPISSFNNEIYKIAQHRPILFVFNKIDKTSIAELMPIVKRYEDKGEVILTNLKSPKAYKQINSSLNAHYLKLKAKNDAKGKLTPPLKCVVLGVPNVGKSTFINLMAKSRVAKVGATAGITRSEQWINCKNYLLLDTPGLLMPKIASNEIGAKLLITGSIRKESLNLNECLVELYKLVSLKYPEKIKSLNLEATVLEDEIFENVALYAKNNNLLLKNNVLDTKKAINSLIAYFQELSNVMYDEIQ